MLIIAVLPVVFVAGFHAFIALRQRSGGWNALRGDPLLLLLALGANYALGFAAIDVDPYYDDEGWQEFVELRYRWVWAAVFGFRFAMVIVPSVFAVRALKLWWRNRRCDDREHSARQGVTRLSSWFGHPSRFNRPPPPDRAAAGPS